METINLKEEVRSLIDKLPENFTWPDLISAVYLRQAMKSEPIQVKGIKQGKSIQVSENINIPDGSLVLIEVREVLPNNEEKLKRMKEFLVSLSDEDREEWRQIAEFLDGDRTTNIKPKSPPAPHPPKPAPPMPPKKRRAPLFGRDREVITISDNFDEPLEDFQDYM